MASPKFCDSTFTEQLLCHKRYVGTPPQESIEMGVLAHAIGFFPQSMGNNPLFRLDFDIDNLGLGDSCEPEFEDAVFQDSRRFGRIDFGGQPQLTAELVRAELGEHGLLLLLIRRLLRLAADDQPLRIDTSAARDGLRKLLHLLKELFSLDEYGFGRSLLLRGLYSLLGFHKFRSPRLIGVILPGSLRITDEESLAMKKSNLCASETPPAKPRHSPSVISIQRNIPQFATADCARTHTGAGFVQLFIVIDGGNQRHSGCLISLQHIH
jgi:hypothetical protein